MSAPSPAEPTAVERLFVALIRCEPEAALELIHPQAEWSPTVWSGEEVYRGREGAKRWLDQFGPGLESLDIRIEKVQVQEDRAVVLGTVFDTRDGGMFAVRVAWGFEIEDDLVRRGRAFEGWDEAAQAVGLD
ncbi:MAG TPA: nuclear transport factor 2 family protein [Solirubrobacterales bacterium]|nr:nuclear transport factor 2 family protein [Solirubrobacterales bacterium]